MTEGIAYSLVAVFPFYSLVTLSSRWNKKGRKPKWDYVVPFPSSAAACSPFYENEVLSLLHLFIISSFFCCFAAPPRMEKEFIPQLFLLLGWFVSRQISCVFIYLAEYPREWETELCFVELTNNQRFFTRLFSQDINSTCRRRLKRRRDLAEEIYRQASLCSLWNRGGKWIFLLLHVERDLTRD